MTAVRLAKSLFVCVARFVWFYKQAHFEADKAPQTSIVRIGNLDGERKRKCRQFQKLVSYIILFFLSSNTNSILFRT